MSLEAITCPTSKSACRLRASRTWKCPCNILCVCVAGYVHVSIERAKKQNVIISFMQIIIQCRATLNTFEIRMTFSSSPANRKQIFVLFQFLNIINALTLFIGSANDNTTTSYPMSVHYSVFTVYRLAIQQHARYITQCEY